MPRKKDWEYPKSSEYKKNTKNYMEQIRDMKKYAPCKRERMSLDIWGERVWTPETLSVDDLAPLLSNDVAESCFSVIESSQSPDWEATDFAEGTDTDVDLAGMDSSYASRNTSSNLEQFSPRGDYQSKISDRDLFGQAGGVQEDVSRSAAVGDVGVFSESHDSFTQMELINYMIRLTNRGYRHGD